MSGWFGSLCFAAWAILASSATAASVLVDFDGQYSNQPPYDPPALTAGGGPLSGSDAVPGSTMSATADFGSLLVTTASASGGTLANTNAGARAAWQDSLTVLGGAGIGQLKLNFAFSGSLSASDTGSGSSATADYSVDATVGGMPSSLRVGSLASNGGPAGQPVQNFSVAGFTFTFGSPFGFDLELSAGSFSIGDDVNAGGPYLASGGAQNLTLTLTGIEVTSDGVTPVPGATLSSQSGFGYGLVPEPSRFLLLGAGLVVTVLGRRRRG